MKLKTILIIFNVLIVVSFVFVFLLPAFFLGWDYSSVFWSENWYLILVFVGVLIVLNLYFARNRRLFHALEGEEWSEVITILEKQTQRRLSLSSIRLLCHSYLLTSQQEKIATLESEIVKRKPALIRRAVMLFGTPYLLSGDGAAICGYFDRYRTTASTADRPWVEWGYAFGLMLENRLDEARTTLEALAATLKPGVLLAVSAYLLDAWAHGGNADGVAVQAYRERIVEKFDRPRWRRLLERERSELHVLVLGKLLGDVERWLYDDQDHHDAK